MRYPTNSKTYQIGEFASRSGVTPDTLRHYERLGLLPKPHRTSGGVRVYSADTVEWLRFIKQAQTLGFTLREVRDLLAFPGSAGAARCRLLNNYLQECEHTLQESERAGGEPPCPVIDTLKATR